MRAEVKARAYDVLTAIHEIELFLEDVPNFLHYQNDLKTKRAIERNLEIIGEAINHIIKADAANSLTDARKIVDTRNRIIHGYDSVSDEIIWSIASISLPQLKMEIELLLQE